MMPMEPNKEENEDKFTSKQLRFCQEYLISGNATDAARKAGYSERTANEQAAQMLSKTKFKNFLQKEETRLRAKAEEKWMVSKEKVLGVVSRVLFGDIRALYDDDGLLKNIKSLTADEAIQLFSVESIEQYETIDGNLTPVGLLKKVKTYDKIRAAAEINKMMGYYEAEKKEVNMSGELGMVWQETKTYEQTKSLEDRVKEFDEKTEQLKNQ